MKSLVLMTHAEFLKFAAERSAGNEFSWLHKNRLLPRLQKIKFEIAATVNCSIGAGNYFHRNEYAKTWLSENATKQWHIEYAGLSWCVARVYFEDEGDAFRFAWAHEDLKSTL